MVEIKNNPENHLPRSCFIECEKCGTLKLIGVQCINPITQECELELKYSFNKIENQRIMLKSTELRIGNWINTPEGQKKFTSSMMFGMYNTEVLSVEQFDSRYKPIPLTEDLLINLGAKKYNSIYFITLFKLKAEIHLENFDDIIVPSIKSDYLDLILDEIKYVHQLQNLYFALTSEELKMKEL